MPHSRSLAWRPSIRCALLQRFSLLVVAGCAMLATMVASASTAVFTFQDKTNLPAGQYQIYVTGFSTAGPYVLQKDGSWGAPAAPTVATPTMTLPCWRYPQDITQVQIDSTQTAISARVYYFIVTDTTTFPSCNPTGTHTGLFNAGTPFTYTTSKPLNLNEPSTTLVAALAFPAWTYSEIGASSSAGTIDLSQVDFYAFPMNTAAGVSTGPSQIGNPLGAMANPDDVVNHQSIKDSYKAYFNALAAAANNNKNCSQDATPIACVYLKLLQEVPTSGSTLTPYVIQNPGGYLAQYTTATQASALNTVFDGVIAKLWAATGASTLAINTGGTLGSVPQDTFTSSIVSITYPGSSPALTVGAMKFTGTSASGSYVAYIVDPADYQTGCTNGASNPGGNPSIPGCVNAASTGYQVYAGAGVFGTPAAGTYTALKNAGLLSANAATYGDSGYDQVVARLGFLISGAMNRGVAQVACPSPLVTWQCWQDETYWYPTTVSTTFPDITQNLFSRWMHTATIGGQPMFVRPPSAVKSASGSAGGGKKMGMAYGFSNDENPTPTATATVQPEVPSKFDSTVNYGGSGYTISFGPWVTAPVDNPTLTVTTRGSGMVSSSPAGIDCGSNCSQAYAKGTVVVLTALPAKPWIFAGWSGACSGLSTTCTVAINDTTNVTAQFGEIAAAAPSKYGLHVVVLGSGSVKSAPAGIDCGSACSTAFMANSSVTLHSVAVAGATFAGWSGACTGSFATCTVTMSDAQTVGASFAGSGHYTLSVTGGAGGVVTTAPGAIDCGIRCIAGFAAGTRVIVNARPNPGYRFAGWSGACSGSATCEITMSANVSVQANYAVVAPGQYALTVHDSGDGTIVSIPPGIGCGAACSAAFAAGSEVTLLATPAAGYRFIGWTGACTGADACVIWLDDLASVDALFVRNATLPVSVEPIPALGEWAMLLLILAMLGIAYWQMRLKSEKRC